jgi:hypothetical protein
MSFYKTIVIKYILIESKEKTASTEKLRHIINYLIGKCKQYKDLEFFFFCGTGVGIQGFEIA